MNLVHPTSIIDPGAKIADDVEIGPYCVVDGDVELGAGVRLVSHVVVSGRTRIGAGTVIYPFASLGHAPQDLKYEGEASSLEIGANCTVRENVTVNPGTAGGGMVTRVGNDCLLMAGTHVAHDCIVGDHVIMANGAALAGHVTVGNWATIGGNSGVHQFVRIGAYAFVGSHSKVAADVVPFAMADGTPAALGSVNIVGLRRRGFSNDDIHTLRSALRELFGPKQSMREQVAIVAEAYNNDPHVGALLAFVTEGNGANFCVPRRRHKSED
ncbi:MAG: acyl-ACP--UDP-N-acetylglucosamine O-acyltransferase [Alphaproteobacteria bacterium]|nr:acyl-ACP--UDP-N-acetylglucosamine O-acyltransferase [Alphaproteobacteria bacterium]